MLVENAYFGRYLTGGYLAYVSQGTVFVAPFDPKALKLTGTAIPVMQGVNYDMANGSAQLSFSRDGTAVHLDGGSAGEDLNVVMVDRKGNASVLLTGQPEAASPRISPDGKRLAFQQGTGNIWIYDLERKTTSRVTLGTAVLPRRSGPRTASVSPTRIPAAPPRVRDKPSTGSAPMAAARNSL